VRGDFIVTGHVASDSVGINPFIDELESWGIEVITYGGIVRPVTFDLGGGKTRSRFASSGPAPSELSSLKKPRWRAQVPLSLRERWQALLNGM